MPAELRRYVSLNMHGALQRCSLLRRVANCDWSRFGNLALLLQLLTKRLGPVA